MNQQPRESVCGCGEAPVLIFACSGAADVGHVADLAARRLTVQGFGRMFCLAGIGGRVSSIMAGAKAASSMLAIDGCPQDCARKTLEEAGFGRFVHMRLSDLGLQRGHSQPSEERIELVVRHAQAALAGTAPAAVATSETGAKASCNRSP